MIVYLILKYQTNQNIIVKIRTMNYENRFIFLQATKSLLTCDYILNTFTLHPHRCFEFFCFILFILIK